jgi:hypothetical protein
MTLQEPVASLASVIGSPELGEGHSNNFIEWSSSRVSRDYPVAQLHAKFWGKSMDDEEEEWRKTQPPIPSTGSELQHEDQDIDDRMDEGADESDGTDRDDDVIPGCYMLHLGIDGLDISDIWIRAEYIRIFDYIEAFFNKPRNRPVRAPSVVITGQPGIGAFSLVIPSI